MPLPPEEPTGENPPDGAIIDYVLSENTDKVIVEILDSEGTLVRSYSSDEVHEEIDSTLLPHPTYWIRPHQSIPTTSGHHRIIWDLRYSPPKGARRGYSISAVQYNTPDGPMGPYVAPGKYTVRLKTGSQISEQPITVRLDPRVLTSDKDLELQTQLSMACYSHYNNLQEWRNAIDAKIENPNASWKKDQLDLMKSFRGDRKPSDGDFLYGRISEVSVEKESIVSLQHKFLFMLNVLQSADVRPTTHAEEAMERLNKRMALMTEKWKQIR